MSVLSADELHVINTLYSNFDEKGNAKLNCTSCHHPLKLKQILGCPLAGYAGQGFTGKSCDGFYYSHELVHQLQQIWYLRDYITNIFDEPNIISEVFFHRKTWEIGLRQIKEKLRG